ncbi:retrovirus-related pol polyprotein from transposon TNT 1-94 [Tanacetum coccineum]
MKDLNNYIAFIKKNFETLKQESSEKYEKNISEIVDLEKVKRELENIVFKMGQSAQTMHMLTKPQNFYDETHKTTLGYQNPLYLSQARRKQPALYNGHVLIAKEYNPVSVCDYEETLILDEERRLKMLEKQTLMGYGDLQMGNILISRVYYVEGLGHNLFSVGKFCDLDLEVAFRKHTCFVWNLEGVDLLSGSRGSNLYTISMADMMKSSLICLLSKASKMKFWLWHRRLSHLNFGTINKLAKQGLVKGLPKLKYTKDHLCSAYGFFSRTKDEAPEIIVKFLKQAQVSLNATVRYLRTDNSTKFLNQTLRNYTKDVGITHTTSTAHRKPELKYLYFFGALCYPTNDFEDLEKLQPKADIGILIGYLPSKKALGLVLNQVTSTSAKPPTKNDWDLLFQPMFDEYFKNPSVASNPISAATLPPPDTAGASSSSSSSSTSIDKDAPSPSTSPNNEATNSALNSTNVDTNDEVAEFDSDTFTNPFAPSDTSSAESSLRIIDTSNTHTFQQPPIYTKR